MTCCFEDACDELCPACLARWTCNRSGIVLTILDSLSTTLTTPELLVTVTAKRGSRFLSLLSNISSSSTTASLSPPTTPLLSLLHCLPA